MVEWFVGGAMKMENNISAGHSHNHSFGFIYD